MRVSDFRFDLPAGLIAQQPAEPREAARLLFYERKTGHRLHRQVRDLGEFLHPGDLLVLNDTRVNPVRLYGKRPSGGKVEALILERHGAQCRGYVKPARKIHLNQVLAMEGGRILLTPTECLGGGLYRFVLETSEHLVECLEACGRAPLPPYIQRDGSEDPRLDRERYQTVFARVPGAVAAPTAGLHFSGELLAGLRAQGVDLAFVTLHVGEGTFAPIRCAEIADHQMHAEEYILPPETAEAVAATRSAGGRVIAVGTTSARTLETCASANRGVRAGTGQSRIFLHPENPPRVIDALLTNFHLPKSTLFMLVCGFAGREEMLALYAEAVTDQYRFYSFGDAMLIV